MRNGHDLPLGNDGEEYIVMVKIPDDTPRITQRALRMVFGDEASLYNPNKGLPRRLVTVGKHKMTDALIGKITALLPHASINILNGRKYYEVN